MMRAFTLLCVLLASSPAFAAPDDAALTKAIVATAETTIIPAYAAFEAQTKELGAATTSFCQTPDQNSYDKVAAAFAATAQSWARVQFISFGPISKDRRASRIAFWPDQRNILGRQLSAFLAAKDEATLTPERFADASVALQGLPALERLLFDDGGLAAFTSGDGAAFRCKTAQAITGNLATIAAVVGESWTGGDDPYLPKLARPGAGSGSFLNGSDAVARFLNDTVTGLIAVRDMKVLAPMKENGGKASEYRRSGAGKAALAANLQGFADMLRTPGGLLGLAKSSGAQTEADAANASLDKSLALIASLAHPIAIAVTDAKDRETMAALDVELKSLRDVLAGPIAKALALTLGFNALDGD